MRILLDEYLPRALTRFVEAQVVKTVPEMGWAGKKRRVMEKNGGEYLLAAFLFSQSRIYLHLCDTLTSLVKPNAMLPPK